MTNNNLLDAWHAIPTNEEKFRQLDELLSSQGITTYGIAIDQRSIRILRQQLLKRGLDPASLQNIGV